MIATEIRNTVRVLKEQGRTLREISRLLKLSRNTARRILREPNAMASPPCKSQTQARLEDAFARCGGNVVRMRQLLAKEGLEICYTTLTRWVRKADLRRPSAFMSSQQWLTEIVHGARSLKVLHTDVDDSSDLSLLLYKAKNGGPRERKKALTVLAKRRGISNVSISKILHSSRKTTRYYLRVCSQAGPAALFGSSTQRSATPVVGTEKKKRILELLHQKPTAFDINRTSWTQKALIQAYKARYDEAISRHSVERLIKDAGYSWRKARRVLTSPDPDYHEKVELLGRTLSSLSDRDLFFFVDEWGPVQVRKRGGKAYSPKHSVPRVPRRQTSKGTVALVAALSATTNQITWTFTKTKDTRSMASLLEILYNQYQPYSRLYVTWDAVSWHNSEELTDWLDQFNEITKIGASGPVIELVPLPTSAQFLNVIEGVLSGMTRGVINNSDYGDPEEMKLAISRYFSDRNQRFRDNPQRAGKAIWEPDFFYGLDGLVEGDYRQSDPHRKLPEVQGERYVRSSNRRALPSPRHD
jgi:transposase